MLAARAGPLAAGLRRFVLAPAGPGGQHARICTGLQGLCIVSGTGFAVCPAQTSFVTFDLGYNSLFPPESTPMSGTGHAVAFYSPVGLRRYKHKQEL